MPAKISMNISNGYSASYLAAVKAQIQKEPPKVNSALTGPMVNRIQHTRPGCGSCGK